MITLNQTLDSLMEKFEDLSDEVQDLIDTASDELVSGISGISAIMSGKLSIDVLQVFENLPEPKLSDITSQFPPIASGLENMADAAVNGAKDILTQQESVVSGMKSKMEAIINTKLDPKTKSDMVKAIIEKGRDAQKMVESTISTNTNSTISSVKSAVINLL